MDKILEMHYLKQFIREALHKSYSVLLKDELKDMGLFITVPETIVRKIESVFDDIKKVATHDESPNHITLLIINKDYDKLEEIKGIIKNVLEQFEPFRIEVHGTNAFINNNQSVLYARITNDTVINMHYKLKQALESSKIKTNHFYGNNPNDQTYKPHMTLGYYETKEQLEDAPELKLEGGWLVDRIELWGSGSPVSIRLGKDIDANEHNKDRDT